MTAKFCKPKTRNRNNSNSNVAKTVKVNVVFMRTYFKFSFDKLSNGMQVDRLCTFGSQVIDV